MFNQVEFIAQKKETYNQNIKALMIRYPELTQKIIETRLFESFHLFRNQESDLVNVYSVENDSFYYKGENPNQVAIDDISKQSKRNVKLGFLLGVGLGYELKYFADEILRVNSTRGVVIIEKELELFKLSLHLFNYSELIAHEKVKLIIGMEKMDLFATLEYYLRVENQPIVFVMKSSKFFYYSGAFSNYPEYYNSVLKEIRDTITYVMNYFGNDPDDSLIGVENMFENIQEILGNPGINMLYNEFKGKPAIIVSTGPSLNKNKHLLEALQDKALIITPDASLKILSEINVVPNIITSLERVKDTYKLLEGFEKEQVENTYFAAAPVVFNDMYKVYPGPRLIVYRNFDHFKWLNIDKGILDIKHSSGNMAFKIADSLGCDPIILVGQDLAYSRDGKSHAKGATFGENQDLECDEEYFVMGNDGEPIKTVKIWDIFRKAYETDVKASTARCINATEGGAFINGTEVMTLAEVSDKYLTATFDSDKIIKEKISGFSSENIEHDKEKLIELFDSTIIDLDEYVRLAKEAFYYIKEILPSIKPLLDDETIDQAYIKSIFDKVMGYKKEIWASKPSFQLYIMHIIQSYNIKFENDMSVLYDDYDDMAKIGINMIEAHSKWFAIMHETIIIARQLIVNAYDKVNELEG